MNDRSPAQLSLVHMLPGHLTDHGIEPTRVFARAGIGWTPEGLPHGSVARAQIFVALEEAARVLADPLVGPTLAARADPRRLGAAGIALFSGLTLRDCLTGHGRFISSILSGNRSGLKESGGRAYWEVEMVGSDADYARFLSEGAIAFVVEAMRHILDGQPFAFEISFSHRGRHGLRLFEDHFQAPVRFGIGIGNVLSFDAALLDRPNTCLGRWPVALDPTAARDRVDGPGLADEDLVSSVNRVIDGMMMAGDVSLVRAARTLGYAPRSFQRQLARCATSFEELTDERRRQAARGLLSNPTVSVGAVAQALAYSHSAHFIRAFQRWEGKSPSQYRRAAAQD